MPTYNPYQDAIDALKSRTEGIYRPNPGSSFMTKRTPSTTMGGAQSIEEDPSLQTYDILKNLEGEQEEKRFGAQMAGDTNAAKAYEGLLGATGNELKHNSVTQASDLMDTQDAEASNQGFDARQQGFKTPQEAAGYKRQLETAKTTMPLQIEQEKTRGAEALLKGHQEQTRGLLGMLNGQGGGGGGQGQWAPTINATGDVSLRSIQPSAAEKDAEKNLGIVTDLAPKVLKMLEAGNPGIAQNPDQYKHLADFLGSRVSGALYKHGAGGSDATLQQLTGYLEVVLPSLVRSGRLNQKIYEDLKQHVPQVGFSDGENHQRLSNIMRYIVPAMQHGLHMPQDQVPSEDPSDPNTWSPYEGDH